MTCWHETLAARISLRGGGLAVVSLAWLVGASLYHRVHAHPPAQASLPELGLCAVLVVLLVVGGALLFVGAGLWKQVPRPRRWLGMAVEDARSDAHDI